MNRAELTMFLAANYRTCGARPHELASHNAYGPRRPRPQREAR